MYVGKVAQHPFRVLPAERPSRPLLLAGTAPRARLHRDNETGRGRRDIVSRQDDEFYVRPLDELSIVSVSIGHGFKARKGKTRIIFEEAVDELLLRGDRSLAELRIVPGVFPHSIEMHQLVVGTVDVLVRQRDIVELFQPVHQRRRAGPARGQDAESFL